MKKILILVQVIGLTLLMACNSGKPKSPDQPYGEKSGIVVYKPMEMMGVKVNQTLYFDDYGKNEARETVVEGSMNGMEMRQHTIDIRNGNVMFHYEIENASGGQNRATKDVYKMTLTPEMLDQMNLEAMSDKMKAKLNYKLIGKETVAGLEGVKFSIAPDSTNPGSLIIGVNYKNIPMKVTMGQMEITADKADFSPKIPADKFKIPEGYTVVDQSKQQMPQLPADTPAEAAPEKK